MSQEMQGDQWEKNNISIPLPQSDFWFELLPQSQGLEKSDVKRQVIFHCHQLSKKLLTGAGKILEIPVWWASWNSSFFSTWQFPVLIHTFLWTFWALRPPPLGISNNLGIWYIFWNHTFYRLNLSRLSFVLGRWGIGGDWRWKQKYSLGTSQTGYYNCIKIVCP